MKTKFYRFNFDKGIPVIGGSMRWRKGCKTLKGYCLQNAVEKFAMPVFKQFGKDAKLNVESAFVSTDEKTWQELNLNAVEIAAFITGIINRK